MLDEHLGYVADATRLELFKSAVAASLPPGAIAGGWRGEAVPPEFHWLDGHARAAVLAYCDGRRSAREIEQAVLRDHPGLYPTAAEISRFVFQVLGRDAE